MIPFHAPAIPVHRPHEWVLAHDALAGIRPCAYLAEVVAALGAVVSKSAALALTFALVALPHAHTGVQTMSGPAEHRRGRAVDIAGEPLAARHFHGRA